MAKAASPEVILKKLRKLESNMTCPNCGTRAQPGIGFGNVCVKFSTFVCDSCKTSHQAISHRVKNITMSNWTMDEVMALTDQASGGNAAALHNWLSGAPSFGGRYNGGKRPKAGDPIETFKKFILDCYEHGMFRANSPYSSQQQTTPSLTSSIPPQIVQKVSQPVLHNPQAPVTSQNPLPTPTAANANSPSIASPFYQQQPKQQAYQKNHFTAQLRHQQAPPSATPTVANMIDFDEPISSKGAPIFTKSSGSDFDAFGLSLLDPGFQQPPPGGNQGSSDPFGADPFSLSPHQPSPSTTSNQPSISSFTSGTSPVPSFDPFAPLPSQQMPNPAPYPSTQPLPYNSVPYQQRYSPPPPMAPTYQQGFPSAYQPAMQQRPMMGVQTGYGGGTGGYNQNYIQPSMGFAPPHQQHAPSMQGSRTGISISQIDLSSRGGGGGSGKSEVSNCSGKQFDFVSSAMQQQLGSIGSNSDKGGREHGVRGGHGIGGMGVNQSQPFPF